MTVKTYYLDSSENQKSDINRDEIESAYQSGQGLLWIDIEGDEQEDISLMSSIFGFHKLSIDDCLGERINPPKVDEFENHIFLFFTVLTTR